MRARATARSAAVPPYPDWVAVSAGGVFEASQTVVVRSDAWIVTMGGGWMKRTEDDDQTP